MAEKTGTENTDHTTRIIRRQVPVDLIETTPDGGGLFYWVLAAPMLLFLAWTWLDLFAYYSPIPFYWLDAVIGLALLIGLVVLPVGIGAFWLVSSLPRLFSNAGWDVQPLEPMNEAELPMIRFVFRKRQRAQNSWRRAWLRAAQGWVYVEIATILIGGLLIIPAFLSATEFGFGRPN